MPRLAREKSETGIYHIMLRGIDKRDIFMSKWDYGKFLEYIKKAKDKSDFQVFGYCLMTNHVHMLLKTEMDDIGDIIKRIAVGYAQYHNIRNGRTGHLFQNRFRSEVVDTEAYFLTVLRYIHQNPVKAGIAKDVKVYKWSSYIEYIDNSKNLLVDADFALRFFPDIKAFEKYMGEKNDDQCLEYDPKKRYTDEDLKKEIAVYEGIRNLYELDIRQRDEILKRIKYNTGASNRQLARVLNIGRGILERIK